MRVKKLEIFGFKSFALRQAISFGEGVTGIVGPNGCGKSNVVDALRWVMGEQNARHLRGGNMQDIIFCGSEKKAPLGFAEVTLTIDNSQQDAPLDYNHYQEIEITRRLYKTGESEYEINRQKARLKDIADFFLGTGVGTKAYSIIEQGRVNEIISAKPADRRLLIEEAAGITKYKSKKIIAERRMQSSRSNLERIVDIKNEVEKRVSILLKEKEKLEKMTALKQRIRQIDLHIASHHFLNFFSTLTFLRRQKNQFVSEIDDNKREIAVIEHSFDKILLDFTQVHEQKRLLENLIQQHKSTLELLKKDLDFSTTTLQDNRVLVGRLSEQVLELDARDKDLAHNIESFRVEQEQAEQEYILAKKNFAAQQESGQTVMARRQQNLLVERDTQKRLVDTATTAARLQSEITSAREQDAQRQIDAKNLAIELDIKTKELTAVSTHVSALERELQQGMSQKDHLQEQLSTSLTQYQEATLTLTEIKKRLRMVDEDLLKHSSRRKSLKEIADGCEWSESGIADLIASEHSHLVKGVLADLIQVESGFEDMTEKYLGHILDTAILANSDELKQAAHFFKNKKLPKATFLLLANPAVSTSLTTPVGLKSFSEFVSIKDDNFSLIEHQLARFFLADDLTTAVMQWKAAKETISTIITKDGEMLLPDGRVIILGHDKDKGILKRKNEIDDLTNKISALDGEIKNLSDEVEKAEIQEKRIQMQTESLQQELKTLGYGLVRLEEAVKQKHHEHARINADIERLIEKKDLLLDCESSVDEKISRLSLQWSQSLDEHKRQEDLLEQCQQEKINVENDYDQYQQSMRDLEIMKVGLHEKLQRLTHNLSESQKSLTHVHLQKKSFTDQIDEKNHDELILKEHIRQSENRMTELLQEIDATTAMFITTQERSQELTTTKESEERRLQEFKAQGQSFWHKLHDVELAINTTDNHIKNVCERIKEKYHCELQNCLVDYHLVPLDEPRAQSEKSELTKQKDRLGNVNENAACEYDELKIRSEFLNAQVADLNDGLMQLESAIKKINKTTQMRFLEAFNNINQQFSKVFPRLFNGGKAELTLSNDEDLLNCGVDIMAQPPGKNIGSIELMSGGEKALTAISLIMAIFLIKPSPFCLLDEVDAPLDEANVARFSQLIKEMSALSQFIVITHNRKTMESADQLYGVTMEDAGLSKIVSVHVQQAFETLRTKPSWKAPEKPTQLNLDDMLS